MSLGKKLQKAVQKLFQEILKLTRVITKGVMNWLLRSFMVLGRRSSLARAGFILPTVVMVILVVTLLVTAIVFRSFDRAKSARNYKVDQTVMAAATPSIDRAKAKLDTLFQDARLPSSTPSDLALYNLLAYDDTKFTFSDEVRLKMAYDQDGSKSITEASPTVQLENAETISTAWRFPVDTNNNGLYDSFTLYSISFRSPSQAADGSFNRARSPLDTRTPPMDEGEGSGPCQAALTTSAKLVGEAGWYKSGSLIKKSIFVYTTTVPITNYQALGFSANKYENYKGQPGFSSLEYQQDRSRIPLSNNAVVYQNDLYIGAGVPFNLNGRITANSNLFLTPTIANSTNSSPSTTLYQVSSKDSCFYTAENSKINVGGNVVNSIPLSNGGGVTYSSNAVPVHLFVNQAPPDTSKSVSATNQSADASIAASSILYNSQAYNNRINYLVDYWVKRYPTPTTFPSPPTPSNPTDPKVVRDQVDDPAVATAQKPQKRLDALRAYFQDRTRRVPFNEVGIGIPETFGTAENPLGTGDSLRPPMKWMFPVDPSDGKGSPAQYATIPLNISGSSVQPPATEPQTLKRGEPPKGYVENFIGDRILVGNNLPLNWYNSADYTVDNGKAWVSSNGQQVIKDTFWDKDNNSTKANRYRTTGVQSLSDVGDKSRDGFWETAAAERPKKSKLDGIGGIRIVTGAGVYERKNSFLPPPTYDNPATPLIETDQTYTDPTTGNKFPIVWPDAMAMSPGGLGSKVFDNVPPAAPPGAPPQGWSELINPLTPANYPAATPTIDPASLKFSKGDLRMRATAVYHYAYDQIDPDAAKLYQKPIACVSNYYDPTNKDTSQNLSTLPPNPLVPSSSNGKSNNGIVYGPPLKSAANFVGSVSSPVNGLFPGGQENAATLLDQLYYQANLVFPTGRFVNEPLRNALTDLAQNKTLSLSEQSAIDSTVCALQILGSPAAGTISRSNTFIGDGTIREVAFLDARQIQAIDRDNPATVQVESFDRSTLTGDYTLSLEERQPLEVRTTLLDLDLLRKKTIPAAPSPSPTPEYLLPDSGIIYASRDDALPDLSAPLSTDPTLTLAQKQAKQLSESAVDYKLDPTRRPTGIMLFNGQKLSRADQETFREEEKGLILATNLPAYVWANQKSGNDYVFNPHSHQEFTNYSATNPYAGSNPDPDFACRPGDKRLPNCGNGDTWRPATVLADAVNLLSGSFRFGFRNEGDYDLRNSNSGNQDYITHQKQNGFFANNYATNGLSSNNNTGVFVAGALQDSTFSGNGSAPTNSGSSYFNNFATPVQRRTAFPEYVMEMCRKLPVSECGLNDWVVGYDANNDHRLYNPGTGLPETMTEPPGLDLNNNGTPGEPSIFEKDVTAGGLLLLPPANRSSTQLGAGTTATPALDIYDQRYARRVAFQRDTNNQLQLTESWVQPALPNDRKITPIALGINTSGQVQAYNYGNVASPVPGNTSGTNIPRLAAAPNNNNALWFRTTQNISGDPTTAADIKYDANRWLYYLPSSTPIGSPTKPDEREDLLLPDVLGTLSTLQTSYPSFVAVASQLNGTSGLDAPSDYAVCDANGVSKYANVTNAAITAPLCPFISNINAARTALSTLTQVNPGLRIWSVPAIGGTVPNSSAGEVRSDNFYIYRVPPTITTTSGSIITLKGNRDTIFVFQASGTTSPINFNNVTLRLDGVDPNNVFWVSNAGVSITSSKLSGNFLGTGALQINDANSKILGGRFLGFSGATITAGATVDAMAPNQPLLVPVLQTHIPRLQIPFTGNNISTADGTTVDGTNWQQAASPSTFNLIAAAGDTPSRPAEFNGGLANFPRFLENWNKNAQSINSTISGSLMEFSYSNYATSPFFTILQIGSTPASSDTFAYPQKYKTSNGGGSTPSYNPPNRLWGYDVGLLSQLPDLFANRFTSPQTGSPDEYFRQVDRNDSWVADLLCAKAWVAAPNQNDANASIPFKSSPQAINDDQRPTTQFCQAHSDW